MGKLIVAVALSVDGYLEGAGGDISAMPLDEAFNVHNAERIRGASSLLYGATTYRQMVAYWPGVPDNPDASAAEQEIARRCAEGIPIHAISDSLTEEETGPWRDQTTIVPRSQAHETVRRLRDGDGDTLVFGSRTVWADLLRHSLVDELHLMIGPGIVAGDTPAFAGVPRTALRLDDVRRYPDSEAVVLQYSSVDA